MSDKYNIKFYNNMKKFLNVPMKLFFDIKVYGLENIPEENYVLAGNHKSIFDIPLLITSIPDEIHFMAKKEVFDIMFFKIILNKMGTFPVNRNNVDISAIRTSLKILKENEVLGIFPEGTRNKSDDILLPFKGGVTKIASRANKLIVPFGISGEYKLGKEIDLNIGEPIDIKSIEKQEQTKYLEERVKELVLK